MLNKFILKYSFILLYAFMNAFFQFCIVAALFLQDGMESFWLLVIIVPIATFLVSFLVARIFLFKHKIGSILRVLIAGLLNGILTHFLSMLILMYTPTVLYYIFGFYVIPVYRSFTIEDVKFASFISFICCGWVNVMAAWVIGLVLGVIFRAVHKASNM